METTVLPPLVLKPTFRNYIWGGRHLAELTSENVKNTTTPIAEAWVIFEDNIILNHSFKNISLKELTSIYPQSVLGFEVAKKNYNRFPLLIKLLDCAEWLSIQVHPDDYLAVDLEGPGHVGKTEAWYVIDANAEAQLIAGTRPGITSTQLEIAIRNGTILDVIQRHSIKPDDAILIDAGTIHALGPGALVYEIQQSSDITYRVFDWNRPAKAGRELHIEKSIAAGRANTTSPIHSKPVTLRSTQQSLITSDYFSLEKIISSGKKLQLSTLELSFHALTLISGQAEIFTADFHQKLDRFESILIPASTGTYQISGDFQILKASATL